MLIRTTTLARVFALSCLTCATTFAQTAVNVTVNAGGAPVRTVDERVFGVNSTMWDPALGTPQTTQLVQQAGIRFIRLPGGSNSDTTHWYSGKNVDTTTNLPSFKWVSGFDVASGLIRNVTPQAQAIVTVNYGSGTPEEAAAWVAYANFPTNASQDVTLGTGTDPLNVNYVNYDFRTASYWAGIRAASPLGTDDGLNFLRLGLTNPMNFKYWEIGNEVYGQSWEYDKHTPKNEPYTYATNAAAFITKMRAVDSTIKIGVVVEVGEDTYSNGTTHSATNLNNASVHTGWTPIVLARLKALGVAPDFLIYHRYDQAPGAETDAGLLQSLNNSSWAARAADIRKQVVDYYGAGGQNIELLVTENNSVYSNPGRQSTSLVNALFLADSVGNILQSEFNGLVWWALRNGPPSTSNLSTSLYGWRNYGDYGMLSTVDAGTGVASYNTPYPTYYSMKLMSFFARSGDSVLSASSSNNLLAVYGATRASDSSMSLLVINKDPTNTATAQFTVSGFTPGSTANVYTFDKSNDNASNPLIASGCPDITSSTVSAGGTFSASFTPYSVNVLTFNRDESARMSTFAPSISTQPANKSVTTGAVTTFSSAATGCPSPTYQWQRMASGTATWANVADNSTYSGSTTGTLTVNAMSALTGDQFRLVATNTVSTTNSNAATLTVTSSSSSSSSSSSVSSSSSSSVVTGGGGGGGGGAMEWRLLAMLLAAMIASRAMVNPAKQHN